MSLSNFLSSPDLFDAYLSLGATYLVLDDDGEIIGVAASEAKATAKADAEGANVIHLVDA